MKIILENFYKYFGKFLQIFWKIEKWLPKFSELFLKKSKEISEKFSGRKKFLIMTSLKFWKLKEINAGRNQTLDPGTVILQENVFQLSLWVIFIYLSNPTRLLKFLLKFLPLSCVYTLNHSGTLCSRACLENLFFHELSGSQRKMTNQLYRQLRENCWCDRKILPQTWKRTKIQTNTVPTEPQTPFVFVEKADWRWFAMNYSRTVRKPRTNYMKIVFTNKCLHMYTYFHS